ncbi:MAG TPA: MMPL family transporter [Xanthomonadaceae bacterium]|nr:MMPL family transporter [Xanthomonadaceae bacterium]
MRPLTAPTRLALALSWLAVLLLLAWWVSGRLQLGGDLRRFMPEPRTPAQKLLIDELGEGPGSRLLLISLSGDTPEILATQSRALREALQASGEFGLVANGEAGLEAIPERLRSYRYLLSPTLDVQPDGFGEAALTDALQSRLQDLGSPAAPLIEPLIPSDPTLETLKLAERWEPAQAPQRLHGVWFDRAGTQALLAAQTHAPGFDPRGQQSAVDGIARAFASARGASPARMELSGPGAFSVEIGARTEREAQWIGAVDSIGLILLLFIAYRSWKIPLFGLLPLASAGLAGLGAVAALFEGVHGITVAFGFTLIGVAQDYPIHLFSHQRPGVSAHAVVRALWPTLATGVIATCIAYLTFLASGVDGLRQLAVFTIAGLGTAALATRYLLPMLLDPDMPDVADSPRLARIWAWFERLPRPRLGLAALVLAAVVVIVLAPAQFWQNDLAKLTPVPADAMARDARLRRELGAPDVRHVMVLEGRDTEAVLRASERMAPMLDTLVGSGAIAGYDFAARYLPSAQLQRARQARLPNTAALRRDLDMATAQTPFEADVFEPFLVDVETAHTARPLSVRDLQGTPLAVSVEGLLLERAGGATALVSLSGLKDTAAVAHAARRSGAQLLDLKQASESLVAAYRQRVLAALALAALLLAATVSIALRTPARVLRVLMPMAITTVLVLAILRGLGVELTLFHLVALILAAGLGLDYALFFEHAGDAQRDQLRTLHGLIVCSLMTLLVFSLLGMSSIPVLRAIGSTVALGVVSNFVLALLIARAPARQATHAT